jgi:cytochrome c556
MEERMHRNIIQSAGWVAMLGVLGVAGAALVAAQAPALIEKRTYVWWAELVSVDAAAKTVTATAPVETPVTTYVNTSFKPGDKVTLIWIANAGKPETGPVLYIEKNEGKGSKLDVGYVLPVEFVAADTAGKTVTFKATVPDSTLQALKSVMPGQWMKVTSPMSQPGETAMIASIESSPRPQPFVRTQPVAQPVAQAVAKVASPEDYDKAMKAIGPAFGATNKAIQSGAMADAKIQLATALSTMMAVQAFWVDKMKDDPATIAKDAVTKMQALDKALSGTDTAVVAAAAKEVGGTCAACHGKYREQDPATKAFSIKAGTL